MTSTMDLVHSYVSEYPNDTCGAKERAALEQRIKELEADAKRYRWLRENCDWTKGGMVFTHLDNVRLGSMCPSLELLDECVDRKLSEAALTKAVEISQEDKLP